MPRYRPWVSEAYTLNKDTSAKSFLQQEHRSPYESRIHDYAETTQRANEALIGLFYHMLLFRSDLSLSLA